MEEPQQSFGLPKPSTEVKPRSFSDDTPNQAVEAPQPKLSLPKPPFSGHSAIPPASGIPQPSFSWPTRVPYQQLQTCSSILQQLSWLTRFLSSSKQRQASFPSLVFLANQASPPASTNLQQPSAEVSWLTRVTSSSKQRQASFPSVVFSWPTRIPHRQLPTCNSILQQFFLANQVSQQQQATTSVCPQPSFPGQPGFPTSIYQPAAAICRNFPG